MDYKLIVLGGGPGGYVAAIKAAQLGIKVLLIEKHKIGGVCLNYGCIPTKTLLRSAKLYKDMMNASAFGIDLLDASSVKINWPNMMVRKENVVNQLVGGVEVLLKHNGVEIIRGNGTVLDPHHIEVAGHIYSTEYMILATGSSPHHPNIEGLKEAFDKGFAVDSNKAIDLDHIPRSMTILGGGVISVEFATLYNNLGTDVTIIQRSSSILKNLDHDVRKLMTRDLKKNGVKIITDVSAYRIVDNTVIYEEKGVEKSISNEIILVSLGRKPNLQGLENLNLKTNSKGVETNTHLETNVKGVYAIGDLNGRYMLAHVASAEGIAAVENIIDKDATIDYNKVPSCIYSFPEVGVVGLTEEEARASDYDVDTSMFPLSANGKALAEGESTGFVKIVFDKTYGEVLGVHIVASHATDMIAEAVASMALEATIHDLAKTIHPHPTLSEIVMEAAHGAVDQPIHAIKK
ncbi:MAG: dihydrolipoyl dehydrogenase [Clostridia bacterium]|nr:dihydrolipoyl dehydrogenase [Clostridia bacterium]